jgi:predicted rRNA methylase YqxC with S4 and FtsJ domains
MLACLQSKHLVASHLVYSDTSFISCINVLSQAISIAKAYRCIIPYIITHYFGKCLDKTGQRNG